MLRPRLAIFLAFATVFRPCICDGIKPPFNCQGSLTDEERDDAVKTQSYYRVLFERGIAVDSTSAFLPKAEKMQHQIWNCSLEAIAESLVKQCPTTAPQPPDPALGLNFARGGLIFAPDSAMMLWYDPIKTTRFENPYNGNPNLKNLANMIYAKTTAFGCSFKRCGTDDIVICIYNEPDVKPGTEIYKAVVTTVKPTTTTAQPKTAETTTTEYLYYSYNNVDNFYSYADNNNDRNKPDSDFHYSDDDCNNDHNNAYNYDNYADNNYYYHNHCNKPGDDYYYSDDDYNNTNNNNACNYNNYADNNYYYHNRCNKPSDDYYYSDDVYNNDNNNAYNYDNYADNNNYYHNHCNKPSDDYYYSDDYNNTNNNNACNYNNNYYHDHNYNYNNNYDETSTAFPKAFRDVALAMHNNLRSHVATARARNGYYSNENFPPASVMYLMVYNCWAEAYAHSVARHCYAGPSPAHLRPGWKENYHVLRTTHTDIYGAIQNAISTWQSELYSYGAPSNVIFTQQMQNVRPRTRFTKMIWAANREVGCATHVCHGRYYNTICLYKNFVNTVGASIYPIGPICGACPAGRNNCNPVVGLCSW